MINTVATFTFTVTPNNGHSHDLWALARADLHQDSQLLSFTNRHLVCICLDFVEVYGQDKTENANQVSELDKLLEDSMKDKEALAAMKKDLQNQLNKVCASSVFGHD
jgi:hypothetical protein